MADSRIEELRRRIERDPGSRLFAQLAEQLRKEGELEEAIGVARAGLERHPNYPSARLTLGRALLDSGDPAAAQTELDAAVKGAPDNILASRLLGEALETLGDLGAALLQLRRTLEMAPSDRHVEARIQAIQARLGAPAPGEGAPREGAGPPPRPAPAQDHTKPMKAVKREDAPPPIVAAAPEPENAEEEEGGLPPTIRIRMPGDPGGGVRAPMPPAAVSTRPSAETTSPGEGMSAPSRETPKEETTLPARTRLADGSLPATLPGRVPAEGVEPAAAPPESGIGPTVTGGAGDRQTMADGASAEDSDLAPTLPSSKAAEYAAIDESLPPTVPPGAVAGPEGGGTETGEPEPPPMAAPPPPPPEAVTAEPAGLPPAAERAPAPPKGRPAAPEPALPAGETPGAAPEPRPPAAEPTAEPEPQPVDAGEKPLSSGTLAELYFQQGLLDRAVEVYREVLAAEPGNETARARMVEIAGAAAVAAASPAAPAAEDGDERGARRQVLERSIERLEALLAIVQRR